MNILMGKQKVRRYTGPKKLIFNTELPISFSSLFISILFIYLLSVLTYFYFSFMLCTLLYYMYNFFNTDVARKKIISIIDHSRKIRLSWSVVTVKPKLWSKLYTMIEIKWTFIVIIPW